MTFLPIVARELRVAARRRGTYWTRVVGAGVVLVIFAGILLIAELSQSSGSGQVGPWLFGLFRWLAFAFVCAAGLFFTSDCLSEEKREGTLGLLFLTDLRGYDVVLGKLLANSLRGAYGLLAAFPMIGLSFLLGGVSGFEFWRLVLVLLNTLFFSLVTGVFVSSLVRDTQRALSGTLLIGLLFIVLLPLADLAISKWDPTRFQARLSLASPGYAFLEFQGTRYSNFWPAMASTHGISWALLGLACFITPRRWQDWAAPAAGPRRWVAKLTSPARRAAWRERLLAINPVRWLAARDPWVTRVVLLSVLGVAALYATCWLTAGKEVAFVFGYGARWLLSVLFLLWLASQASRFFVDANRAGMLELLLATPLPAREIVRGQWWALCRSFFIPALILFCAITAQGLWQVVTITRAMATSATVVTASAGTNAPAGGATMTINWQNQFLVQQVVALVFSLLNFFARLLAIGWFGMWMGLTTRKPNVALMKTVLFVGVLPWIGYWFVTMLMYSVLGVFSMRGGNNQFLFWLPTLGAGTLAFGLNVMFFLLARRQLLVKFRETFARSLGLRLRPVVPPALPATRGA